jgi:hypothetical protein
MKKPNKEWLRATKPFKFIVESKTIAHFPGKMRPQQPRTGYHEYESATLVFNHLSLVCFRMFILTIGLMFFV